MSTQGFTPLDSAILSQKEAARNLGMTSATFYRQIQKLLLPTGVRISSTTRKGWPASDISRFAIAYRAGVEAEDLQRLTHAILREREADLDAITRSLLNDESHLEKKNSQEI